MSKVYVKETGKYGKGVFAKHDIKKGEVVLQLKGKLIVVNDLKDLPEDLQNHCRPVGINKYVTHEGIGNYVNHSCDANCFIDNDNNTVAKRDIRKDEEITEDYSTFCADDWTMECHCGSKNCRKIIGKWKDLPEDVKKRLSKWTPDWVKNSSKKVVH